MKKKTKIIIFIGIFLAIIVMSILLLQMFLLEEHTGVITDINNNTITFEERYPIIYSYPKDLSKIFDKYGNVIDSSKLVQGNEVYIYIRGTNELQAATVEEIGDSKITFSTYYSSLYSFSATNVPLKDINGNIINLYDLNIGDNITVKEQHEIISYFYDQTVKNLKNIKSVTVFKNVI